MEDSHLTLSNAHLMLQAYHYPGKPQGSRRRKMDHLPDATFSGISCVGAAFQRKTCSGAAFLAELLRRGSRQRYSVDLRPFRATKCALPHGSSSDPCGGAHVRMEPVRWRTRRLEIDRSVRDSSTWRLVDLAVRQPGNPRSSTHTTSHRFPAGFTAGFCR